MQGDSWFLLGLFLYPVTFFLLAVRGVLVENSMGGTKDESESLLVSSLESELQANGYTQEKVEERLYLYRSRVKDAASKYFTRGCFAGVLLGCSLAVLMVGIEEQFAKRPPVALMESILEFLLPFLRYFVVVMAIIGFVTALSMIFEVVRSRRQ